MLYSNTGMITSFDHPAAQRRQRMDRSHAVANDTGTGRKGLTVFACCTQMLLLKLSCCRGHYRCDGSSSPVYGLWLLSNVRLISRSDGDIST